MGKQGVSLESLIKYRDDGWKFTIKNVKGRKYITRKRKEEERSLGPYSDDLWSLISEIVGVQVKEAVTLPDENSPQTSRVSMSESTFGLRIVKAIKLMGIEPGLISEFIEGVYREAENQHLAPETFMKVAKAMHEMRVEGRGDYLALEEDIANKRSLSNSLEEKVSGLNQRVETLSKGNIEAERMLEEVNRTLQSKTELAGKVTEAGDLGLRPSQLGVIVDSARKAGAQHGLSAKDSLERLTKDLEENWKPKLGFEIEKTRLSSELEQLIEKIRFAESKEKITLERVRSHEEVLKGFEELGKYVSPREIIDFKKIIVGSGQDVSTFRSEIDRLGSVTEAVGSTIVNRVVELTKLEGRIVTLQAQELKLIDQRRALEGEIKTLSSDAVKSLIDANNTIHDVAEGLKEDFEDPVNGYRARIKILGDKAMEDVEIELKEKREALKKGLESLSSFVTRSANEVESLKKNTWETGKLVGSNMYLARLARIVGGEPVEQIEAVTTMIMTIDTFSHYLRSKQLIVKCPSARSFGTELRGLLS